jgi:hypothetical protein
MIRGISVMRRTSDSWVNATQILKVAGIPKSARTKILDKEIATGIHEKVQGGCELFALFDVANADIQMESIRGLGMIILLFASTN